MNCEPSDILASTKAGASSGADIVGMVRPYSVPCPFGAVTSVPAVKKSATFRPALAESFRSSLASLWSQNMSRTVVTPKFRDCLRDASPSMWTWESIRPGSSVHPAPSIS